MTIDYGTLLKMRRKELGLSQAAVADRAVCHRTTVYKAEGGGSMTLDVFLSILNVLGLKMEIVEDEGFRSDLDSDDY